MERKLLEFESELDATMLRLRKNLMVIRLLGLMSEDEELQDQLMKDSSRLLDFICITLNRGAAIAVARDAIQCCLDIHIIVSLNDSVVIWLFDIGFVDRNCCN